MSEQIKETELMIGNIVTVDNPKCHPHLKGVPMIIKEILINGEYAVKLERVTQTNDPNTSYSQFMKFIRPITLTEDILLKCGFKVSMNKTCYGMITESGKTRLSIFHDGLFKVSCEDLEIKVKYLHQLQNLFKALTQTDLKVEV